MSLNVALKDNHQFSSKQRFSGSSSGFVKFSALCNFHPLKTSTSTEKIELTGRWSERSSSDLQYESCLIPFPNQSMRSHLNGHDGYHHNKAYTRKVIVNCHYRTSKGTGTHMHIRSNKKRNTKCYLMKIRERAHTRQGTFASLLLSHFLLCICLSFSHTCK